VALSKQAAAEYAVTMTETTDTNSIPVKGEEPCPICGRPMTEHSVDHSTTNGLLRCPAPPLPERPDNEPVDEFGRIKRPS
jgi:hypothetical protein